jgi:hypothetical protein
MLDPVFVVEMEHRDVILVPRRGSGYVFMRRGFGCRV